VEAEVAEEAVAVEDDGPSPMIDIGVDNMGYGGYVEANDILEAAQDEEAERVAEEAAKIVEEEERIAAIAASVDEAQAE